MYKLSEKFLWVTVAAGAAFLLWAFIQLHQSDATARSALKSNSEYTDKILKRTE